MALSAASSSASACVPSGVFLSVSWMRRGSKACGAHGVHDDVGVLCELGELVEVLERPDGGLHRGAALALEQRGLCCVADEGRDGECADLRVLEYQLEDSAADVACEPTVTTQPVSERSYTDRDQPDGFHTCGTGEEDLHLVR